MPSCEDGMDGVDGTYGIASTFFTSLVQVGLGDGDVNQIYGYGAVLSPFGPQ